MSPTPSTTVPRAAFWRGQGLVGVEPVELPELQPGQVLVRIGLATVCGSDLHTVSGRRASPCPSILGHEAVATVVGIGAGGAHAVDGSTLATGDRVVAGVTVACGRCDRCRQGRTAKCRHVRKVGHESAEGDWPLSGTYASHLLLPAGASLARVPDSLPDAVAAPAGCATATVMASLERAGELAGRRVLVSGAGMLGLTAVAAAADAGASEVAVVDVDADRLALARRFGATATVTAGSELPEVDVACEFSGAAPAVTAALQALDVGGRLVLAGSVSPGPAVPLDPERVVRRWLTVAGVHNYEPRHLQQAVSYLDGASHRPWSDLVAGPLPLERVGELLTSHSQRVPRTSVVP